MGLLSFLKKTPQKIEAAGDAYFNVNKFGSAKLEYEYALDMIEKKHPDEAAMKERVQEKLKNSKESLARQHLESGDRLIEGNALDEAKKLFSLALSLTEDSGLQQMLKERMVVEIVETPDEEPEALFYSDPDTEFESEPEPAEDPVTYDAEHEFDILCMTLPEDMKLAYGTYGDTFKEGLIALSHGDFILAAEKLRMAMDENPSVESHIPVELATALINLGQTEESIECLTAYIQNHPSSFHGISILCDILCDLKRFDHAHKVIEQSPETIRESTEAVRLNGRICFLEGDYQQAEEIFRDVMAATDWDTDVARELAMTLASAGKTQEALTLYTDLLNQCSRCGQRTNPLDKKAFADLSLKMNDFSDKILNLYLDLAHNYAELRSDCFHKASMIFKHNGNDKEAARFRKLADATV